MEFNEIRPDFKGHKPEETTSPVDRGAEFDGVNYNDDDSTGAIIPGRVDTTSHFLSDIGRSPLDSEVYSVHKIHLARRLLRELEDK